MTENGERGSKPATENQGETGGQGEPARPFPTAVSPGSGAAPVAAVPAAPALAGGDFPLPDLERLARLATLPLAPHGEAGRSFAPVGKSIVLVGLMGAGKSVLGRRLSAWLDWPFVDSDAAIEDAARCSIADIFARLGEPAFREAETRIIGRLLEASPCVLATGGGAFMNAATRQRIREKGISLWLKADLEVLVRRTAGRTHRPILNQGDPRQILSDLIDRRYPVYAEADVIVTVNDESPESTCQRAVQALEAHLGVSLPNKGGEIPPSPGHPPSSFPSGK